MCQVVEIPIVFDDFRFTFAKIASNDGIGTGFTRVSCKRFQVETQSSNCASAPMKYSFSEEVPESRIHITEYLWNQCFLMILVSFLRKVLQNEQ